MWPGLVGKGTGEGQEPPISLEHMLDLTAAANVNGQKFEGIDYFLFLPHTNPEASDDEIMRIADLIAGKGFNVGSLVAPVWGGTIGDSAMGDAAQREKFLSAVKMACRIAGIFNKHGVRKYGVIRIDSAEFGVNKWGENPTANTAKIAETFREAGKIAEQHGERLAAEGEICWAGMHWEKPSSSGWETRAATGRAPRSSSKRPIYEPTMGWRIRGRIPRPTRSPSVLRASPRTPSTTNSRSRIQRRGPSRGPR